MLLNHTHKLSTTRQVLKEVKNPTRTSCRHMWYHNYFSCHI